MSYQGPKLLVLGSAKPHTELVLAKADSVLMHGCLEADSLDGHVFSTYFVSFIFHVMRNRMNYDQQPHSEGQPSQNRQNVSCVVLGPVLLDN